jgi:hypothetical protein
LPATWVVPAFSVLVVFVATQFGEISARGLWREVLLGAFVMGAVFVLVIVGIAWLYKSAKERGLVS